MRILALDTTTVRGSLAWLEGEEILGEVRVSAAEGHSAWLHAGVDLLLRSLGTSLRDLDGLAVTVGPGSFTGLRVGIATVQGLALGAGKPCFGASALEVLSSLVPARSVVAVMDAFRSEVYAGVYEAGRPAGPPYCGPLEGLAPRLKEPPAFFVGDGVLLYRDRLRRLWPQAEVLEADLFLAAPLARLAARALAEGRAGGPESLLPLYLRGADLRLPAR
jgi:tRNA threonylcarbamoyladenosine biosynthesis protein TsaB